MKHRLQDLERALDEVNSPGSDQASGPDEPHETPVRIKREPSSASEPDELSTSTSHDDEDADAGVRDFF